MNCNEAREHLSPHLEDHLGPKERAAVSEHLLACRPCRALRDEMVEALYASLPEMPEAWPAWEAPV